MGTKESDWLFCCRQTSVVTLAFVLPSGPASGVSADCRWTREPVTAGGTPAASCPCCAGSRAASKAFVAPAVMVVQVNRAGAAHVTIALPGFHRHSEATAQALPLHRINWRRESRFTGKIAIPASRHPDGAPHAGCHTAEPDQRPGTHDASRVNTTARTVSCASVTGSPVGYVSHSAQHVRRGRSSRSGPNAPARVSLAGPGCDQELARPPPCACRKPWHMVSGLPSCELQTAASGFTRKAW